MPGAQIFYRKVYIINAQCFTICGCVGHNTLAQYKTFQLNGKGWRGRSGWFGFNGGFFRIRLGSGNGLAFADFNHGAVQPYFTHDNIARKQGAQLQLGHAAFDGDDHALPIAGAAPVRLSKIDAGGEKGNSGRAVKR